jgi:uncharacterized membrane protein YfcA
VGGGASGGPDSSGSSSANGFSAPVGGGGSWLMPSGYPIRLDYPGMTVWEAIAITAAGFVAGGVNTVVGSGSLVTFPTLVALGYPSVVANVSNTIGLVPGSVSGAIGYRRELRGQWRRTAILAVGTTAGALIGGILLLSLPSEVFDLVVPILILLAVGLMALRPAPRAGHEPRADRPVAAWAATFATGIYGGYFGAAQGIILLAALRLCFADNLQRLNGTKNVLAGVANGVAAVLFMFAADPAWGAAGLIAAGSIAGAQVGARYGRRLPQEVLRRVVIVGGTIVAVILFVRAV